MSKWGKPLSAFGAKGCHSAIELAAMMRAKLKEASVMYLMRFNGILL